MKLSNIFARFIVPNHYITLHYLVKFKCIVSPKAEVELSKNLVIGKGSQISSFVKIKASAGLLKIGSTVDVAVGSFLSSGEGKLIIGDDCLIGPNCVILADNYNYSRIDQTFREQGHASHGTIIGNNVSIGAGTVILDGSEIGDGVMISANSVVSGKIAENSVVQGNPATVIFTRR